TRDVTHRLGQNKQGGDSSRAKSRSPACPRNDEFDRHEFQSLRQASEKESRPQQVYRAKALSVLACRRFTASSAERNRRSRRPVCTGDMIRFRPSVAISKGVSIVICRRSSTGLSMIRAALLPWGVNRFTMRHLLWVPYCRSNVS